MSPSERLLKTSHRNDCINCLASVYRRLLLIPIRVCFAKPNASFENRMLGQSSNHLLPCTQDKQEEPNYVIQQQRLFGSRVPSLLCQGFVWSFRKNIEDTVPEPSPTLRGCNMPINNCITSLLLLRIMMGWEHLAPRAEFILKCFQLTLGTRRKASNLSQAEIWKVCREHLSRRGISLKPAHHNLTTSAPPLSSPLIRSPRRVLWIFEEK